MMPKKHVGSSSSMFTNYDRALVATLAVEFPVSFRHAYTDQYLWPFFSSHMSAILLGSAASLGFTAMYFRAAQADN